jgi:hypothetical protein
MKRLTTAVICIAGAMVTTVFAQQPSQPGSQTQPGQRQPGSQPPRDSIYGATGRAGMLGQQVRASKVIGADVKTATGEELGKIEDVILNPQSGRVAFAVLNWENKLVPVPFRTLTVSGAGSSTTPGSPTTATPQAGMDQITFTAQIDKEKLQNAPTISDRTRWSELQQSGFTQRIYAYYGMPSEGVGAPGSGSETGQGREGSTIPRTQPQTSPGTPPGTSPRTTPN